MFNIFKSLAKTFEDNKPSQRGTKPRLVDSKLLSKIREKKMAQGQKTSTKDFELN